MAAFQYGTTFIILLVILFGDGYSLLAMSEVIFSCPVSWTINSQKIWFTFTSSANIDMK